MDIIDSTGTVPKLLEKYFHDSWKNEVYFLF